MTTETRTALKSGITKFPAHATTARPPLRTLSDFAAEVGVSVYSLNTRLRTADAPAVSLKLGSKNYYIHSELRAWWKLQVPA